MDFIKVICVSKEYIRERDDRVKIDGVYYAKYEKVNLGVFGASQFFTIYNLDKTKIGQYFAIDFVTVADLRERRIKAIFED
jgi:uncharacterized protein YpmB